jgi:hypothetical protein
MNTHLLPEEDALDDPDEDGDADPTRPGDLWFRVGFSRVSKEARFREGSGTHRILSGVCAARPRKCATR